MLDDGSDDLRGEASFRAWCAVTAAGWTFHESPAVQWYLCESGERQVAITNHLIRAYLRDRLHPLPHPLVLLLSGRCKCKCKSSVLFSVAPTERQLTLLDHTPWGPKLCAAASTVLGFELTGAPLDINSSKEAIVLSAAQRCHTGHKAASSITRKRKLWRHWLGGCPVLVTAARILGHRCAAASVELIAQARRYLLERGGELIGPLRRRFALLGMRSTLQPSHTGRRPSLSSDLWGPVCPHKRLLAPTGHFT